MKKQQTESGCLGPLPHLKTICTIGHAGLSAQNFFKLLGDAQVTLLVDIRQHPSGSRTFYTLQRDLPYFLRLHEIRYTHVRELAPSRALRRLYRDRVKAKDPQAWDSFARIFNKELTSRKVLSNKIEPVQAFLRGPDEVIALLCTEKNPNRCHRSLVANLISRWHTGVRVIHLGEFQLRLQGANR